MENTNYNEQFQSITNRVGRSSLAIKNTPPVKEIVISNPKWSNLGINPLKGHRIFTIKTRWNIDVKGDSDFTSTVQRRYGHFLWLREKLLSKEPFEPIPLLPPKNWLMRIESDNSEKVIDRMNRLQHFLTIIVTNPVLNAIDDVKDFLVDTDEEFYESQYQDEASKTNLSDIIESTKGNIWSIGKTLVGRIPFINKKKDQAPSPYEIELHKMRVALDNLNNSFQKLAEGITKEIEFKKKISFLQIEFGQISSEIGQGIKSNKKNKGVLGSVFNATNYLEALVGIDPMKKVSEKDKELVDGIREDLDFPLSTHQVLLNSMYECLERVELKIQTLDE